MELAEVELGPGGLSARGVQIGTSGVEQGDSEGEAVDIPGRYRVDYDLRTDSGLITSSLSLTARSEAGERRLELRRDAGGRWDADGPRPDLEGAVDCDLALSPLTNFMPIRRERLTDGGDPRDFVMAWVMVPSLAVHRSEQRYEPVDANTVRYVSEDRSFIADITLDDDGFALLFPGLGERV